MIDDQQDGTSSLHLAAELTVAWLSNHGTRAKAEEVPAFLRTMHETVLELRAGSRPVEPEPAEAPEEYPPAVTVRKSLASPDHIISMIDGKPYRTLKRHLATNGLTPDQYRERYGLKPDYPMVAPNYSASRSETAKRIGLGRKPASNKIVSCEALGTKQAKMSHTGVYTKALESACLSKRAKVVCNNLRSKAGSHWRTHDAS